MTNSDVSGQSYGSTNKLQKKDTAFVLENDGLRIKTYDYVQEDNEPLLEVGLDNAHAGI